MSNESTSRTAWILVAILAGFFLLFAGFLLFASALLLGGRNWEKEASEGVGVLEITGPIADSLSVLEDLHDLLKDDRVKAIVVRVDSPGGAVAPSQEIYNEILKARQKKKVVVSMGTVAASGGYYIAAAGEKIIASEGTITGSIGVIAQITDLTKLKEVLKFDVRTYKTGALKDSGSPFRETTEADDKMFNDLINDAYDQFVSDVAKSRNLPVEEVRKVADGRVMTGRQAKAARLVDEFGSFQDAVRIAGTMGGVSGEPEIIRPEKNREELIRELLESSIKQVVSALRPEMALELKAVPGR
ncbi:MAG: hypothetical protein GMKNLPBB_01621 [Myxococcota bacterium]|nr:hypothetical protein [Myxococcota bacterium]